MNCADEKMIALTGAGIIYQRNPTSRILLEKFGSFHSIRCFPKFKENGFIRQSKLLEHRGGFPRVRALTYGFL
jgi:hypothetical protein